MEDVKEMSQAKLLVYRIPTYPRAVPVVARLPRWTLEEI